MKTGGFIAMDGGRIIFKDTERDFCGSKLFIGIFDCH